LDGLTDCILNSNDGGFYDGKSSFRQLLFVGADRVGVLAIQYRSIMKGGEHYGRVHGFAYSLGVTSRHWKHDE